MKVGLISYPMLWQRHGGVQNKIRNTLIALRGLGIESRLFDINTDHLTDFDLLHVFCTGSSNYRIVEAARDADVPVVLSSVLSIPYSRFQGWRDWLLHSLVRRLSGYYLNTNWGQNFSALAGAERIIALGQNEANAICNSFGIPAERIRIIPNGIHDAFFSADSTLFLEKWPSNRPFILMSASLSQAKNQLGAVRAMRGLEVDLVLFGAVGKSQQSYLDACLSEGAGQVYYLGMFAQDDPFYVSAFAAAQAVLIPSYKEVTPNVALEALAAGTPVICTLYHAFDQNFPRACWQEVDPKNSTAIRSGIQRFLDAPPSPTVCRNAVHDLRWSAIAERIVMVYREILQSPDHDANTQ